MNKSEKKSFLKAINEQIVKYEEHIINAHKYSGKVGACPICEAFYIQEESYSKSACRNCPMLNFRIYDFNEGVGYPCSYRRTFPTRIRDIFTLEQLDKYYLYEGEKAALNFWNKMLKFVTKTPASQIDFSENSPFVMQMVWIDKVVAADWKRKIKESIKDFES